MRTIKKLIAVVVLMLFAVACNDGIDPITQVDPGPDASAPEVTINYPIEGTKIKVNEPVVSIMIDFEVTDDIEVANISVKMDGSEIATMSDFKDYRRVLAEVAFDNLTTGVHELSVTATDLEAKSTTSTVSFEKEPPYIPLFANEVLYMAFDGDYTELISVTKPEVVGSPGFAGEGVASPNAYAGGADAHLKFPTETLNLGTEMTGMFWYKVNSSPDRAGILVIGDDADDRKQGFRLFREGGSSEQRIKMNVGTGTGESWNDGGVIDVTAGDWLNVAFTISETKSVIYFNGIEQRSADLAAPIDWTGSTMLDIASGGDTFSYWNHKSDHSFIDELRIFNTAMTQEEIRNVLNITNPYEPADGETLFMTFDDTHSNKVSGALATEVGSPGYAGEAKKGSNAYAGAEDSYLTLPSAGLQGESFSAAFWYKVNAEPDRAGILVMGPEDPDNAEYPTKQNNRKSGFRFFRENAGGKQRVKLNVGNGTADTWIDGGSDADIDPTTGEWVHLAFTITPGKAKVYINGEMVKESDVTGVDWTGCDILSIMSGAPRFTGWNHKSDSSFMDDLHLYNKALSQEEIQALM